MHSQALNILAVVALTAAPAAAIDQLMNNTIPMACMQMCAPIAQLTSICDVSNSTSGSMSSMSMSMSMTMSGSMSMTASSGMPTSSAMSGMGMGEMDMSNPEAEKANAEMAKAQAMGDMAAKQPGAITMNAGMKKKKRQMENMEGMDMSNMEMSEEEMKATMSSGDTAEMNCVCENKSFKVAEVMGLCESCMVQNNGEMAAVQNMQRIMSECKFSSTSFSPSATSVLAGVSVQATKPATNSASATGMSGMNMGAGNRVEAAVGIWSAGMLMASFGLGAGFVFGMI